MTRLRLSTGRASSRALIRWPSPGLSTAAWFFLMRRRVGVGSPRSDLTMQRRTGSASCFRSEPLPAATRESAAIPSRQMTGGSLAWRAPIDAWLAELALKLFAVVPFSYAVIGFEVLGDELPDFTAAVSVVRPDAYVVSVAGRPVYFAATE